MGTVAFPYSRTRPLLDIRPSLNRRYLTNGNGHPFLPIIRRTNQLFIDMSINDAMVFVDRADMAHFNVWLEKLTPSFERTLGNSGVDLGWTNINGHEPFNTTISTSPYVWDFGDPNTAYWDHVKSVCAAFAARGKWVMGRPLYTAFPGNQWGIDEMVNANSDADCTAFGTFLGTWAADIPNLMFVDLGDHSGDSVNGNADGITLGKCNLIRAAARAADRAGRLWMTHGQRNTISSVTFAARNDNINQIYTGGATPTGDSIVHDDAFTAWDANRGPVCCIESLGYPQPIDFEEDMIATGQAFRTQIWQHYFSGGWGGYALLTQNAPPDPYPSATGGSEAMRIVAEFLRAIQWQKLEPNRGSSLVTSGGGTEGVVTYKPRALATDGTIGVVYVPDGTTVTVNLSLMAGSGAVTCRWYDPTSGQYTAATGSPIAQGSHAFVASSEVGTNDSGDDDWVLLLES